MSCMQIVGSAARKIISKMKQPQPRFVCVDAVEPSESKNREIGISISNWNWILFFYMSFFQPNESLRCECVALTRRKWDNFEIISFGALSIERRVSDMHWTRATNALNLCEIIIYYYHTATTASDNFRYCHTLYSVRRSLCSVRPQTWLHWIVGCAHNSDYLIYSYSKWIVNSGPLLQCAT